MSRLIALCLVLARAVLGDTQVRRQWMFLGTLGVLAFVFGVYFIAGSFLRAHPVLFALYILASFAGVIVIALFAFYDMLMVSREFREARRTAREEMLREIEKEHEQDP